MKLRFYPRSIVRLVAAGYALVALPLLATVVIAIIEVDRLAEQGYGSALQAEAATQLSRSLVESAVVMGRNLAQYHVLEDRALYAAFLERRDDLQSAVGSASALGLGPEYAARLGEFVRAETSLYERFGTDPATAVSLDAVVAGYSGLVAQGQLVLAESSALVRGEANSTIVMAGEIKQVIAALIVVLVPVAIILAAWLTRLIGIPIRELNSAIRQLGSGDFARPIEVAGPRDLTELGQQLDWLRQRIVSLEAQKITFLQHMSHELKTPLTTIREGAELLSESASDKDEEETLQITRILRDKTLQLQMLIENLLEFARTRDSDPVSPDHESFVVSTLIDRVLREFSLNVDNKDLNVNLQMTDAAIRADRNQIKIVLDNLISNAIKFSPHGGRLTITVTGDGDRTSVSVRDEGPGIAPAERERIFEPFFQGSATSTSPLKGTGLGLAIVKEYVDANGGRVDIPDEGPGAHLRLVFPRCRDGERHDA